jgi:hypothetical protein
MVQDLPLGIQVIFFISLLYPPRAQYGDLGNGSQIKENESSSDAVIKPLLFYPEYLRGLINVTHKHSKTLFVNVDMQFVFQMLLVTEKFLGRI